MSNVNAVSNSDHYAVQNDQHFEPVSPSEAQKFNAGQNDAIGQHADAIKAAAQASGLDPNLIGGVMWAESRGNQSTTTKNVDGTQDVGLMQISNERWQKDVIPNLTSEQRATIEQVTGKMPEELDMNNPADNVIGGAMELRQWVDRAGGDVAQGLRGYNTGEINPADLHDTSGIGSPGYVDNVLAYRDDLASGAKLREDPFGA